MIYANIDKGHRVITVMSQANKNIGNDFMMVE